MHLYIDVFGSNVSKRRVINALTVDNVLQDVVFTDVIMSVNGLEKRGVGIIVYKSTLSEWDTASFVRSCIQPITPNLEIIITKCNTVPFRGSIEDFLGQT
tara:strand:- start:6066 stop:6365 length:300 start_codon:yes stop_codon:yes gene_type:complete